MIPQYKKKILDTAARKRFTRYGRKGFVNLGYFSWFAPPHIGTEYVIFSKIKNYMTEGAHCWPCDGMFLPEIFKFDDGSLGHCIALSEDIFHPQYKIMKSPDFENKLGKVILHELGHFVAYKTRHRNHYGDVLSKGVFVSPKAEEAFCDELETILPCFEKIRKSFDTLEKL